MAESAKPKGDISLENPTPAASLESIVCTDELHRRPRRPPDHEKENRALVALANALADSPRTILQTLADKVCEVLDSDSSGLSLLTKDQNSFVWPAVAGAWRSHIGAGAPRNFAPCGAVLDHNVPMLFTHWERRYPYLGGAMPLAEEGLIVPFYVNGKAAGTIWAVAHDHRRKFDAEDLRLLESMGRFASVAYQTVQSVDNLISEIAAREKAEAAVRELANGLEKQVRLRTEELEQRNKQLAEARARLAEEKLSLERSEAYLAEAQRLSRTGSWHLNVSTGDVFWSQEFFAIFGFDPGETRPSYALNLKRIHPEDRARVEQIRRLSIQERKDFEVEYRILLPEGSIKYLHSVAHCLVNPSGDIEYIGAVKDVTQLRLAEQAFDKLRSEIAHVTRLMSHAALSASIAHEVNQPLSGIITNASTCLRTLDADPPNVDVARETARRIIRDGNRASDVIARLRALFSKKEFAAEPLDLNEATREVISLLLSEFRRNSLVLRTELADNLPPVIGDRVELQQVILNLLRNAADAMCTVDDRPRQLFVKSERAEGDQVRLSVQDAGVGFEHQAADRLFDPFYSTKIDGMGMGLSVSRSIIDSHHGRLWVTPNEGHGVTFSFSIPCISEGSIGARTKSDGETPASRKAA